MHLPAALGDGLINGFVDLLVVVVLVSGVLPHVGFEGRRMTAHVATERAPRGRTEGERMSTGRSGRHACCPSPTSRREELS